MPSSTRIADRVRMARHVAGAVTELWSSDLNRATVTLVDPQPGEVLVDLGAGAGPASVEAAMFVGPTGRVVAIDPSRTMRSLLRLRCRARRHLRPIEVRSGSAESMPVEEHSVDALWAVNATHHFDDLDAFATELARVLRAGGRVVLVEEDFHRDNDHTLRMPRQGGHQHKHSAPHTIDVDRLLALMNGVGLVNISATYGPVAGTTATIISAGAPS